MSDFSMGGQWSDPDYVNRVSKDLRDHGLERLEKEKELIMVFLANRCEGDTASSGGDASATCAEMRNKLSAVVAFINTHKKVELDQTDDATLRQLAFVTGGPHEGANMSLVQRSMFAKVGALIETTQRQLITPSASATAAPYKSQVYFHVYVISNQDTYQPISPRHFDYTKFKSELERLALPRQKFNFVLHQYSMAEDQALAVAYANALRSSVVASLKVSRCDTHTHTHTLILNAHYINTQHTTHRHTTQNTKHTDTKHKMISKIVGNVYFPSSTLPCKLSYSQGM